jgi:hypothetical protein
VWDWNMCGTKLKKLDGWVPIVHTANEDDAAATALPEDRVDGPNSSGSDDDELEREPFGTTLAVQLLAIRASYRITAYDWTSGRCIYRVREGEVHEEGTMADLVPIGPSQLLEGLGCLTFQVFTDDGDEPLVAGWGVPDADEGIHSHHL